jgi:hypothetical protein
MRFLVTPLVGVGPVLLGMRRDEVRAVLGSEPVEFRKSPEAPHTTDAFHGGFHVHYSRGSTVEFIEVARGFGLKAILDGVDALAIPAAELLRRLERRTTVDEDGSEPGYAFVFPEWELSLWRPVDSDTYFSTVGIGVLGYFSGRAG